MRHKKEGGLTRLDIRYDVVSKFFKNKYKSINKF